MRSDFERHAAEKLTPTSLSVGIKCRELVQNVLKITIFTICRWGNNVRLATIAIAMGDGIVSLLLLGTTKPTQIAIRPTQIGGLIRFT
jgi:hypothetical protein